MPGSIIARLSRIGAAGALVLMSVFTGGSAGGQGTSGLSDDVPVALILDASRSMLDEVEGRRRMDVARDAMLQIAPGPLTQRRASLVSFGNDRVNECDNIPIIHPFGSDDVRSTLDAIQALEPAEPGEGEESLFGSPLYRALEVAMDTLPAEAEEASIVMVTDGIDACDRNICELVLTLQDRGITVDILAIDVDPVLLGQLACVPAGTGGALLPSDNLTSISSYVSLLSRAAQGESVDLQPYIDDAERLRAELSTMREERDALDRLGQSLDADLLRVFGELDEARIRVRSLEAVLAYAEDQNAEQVNGLEAQIADAQARIAALQDRILALDAAATRCDQEKAALEQQLTLALGRIAELESLEPVEVVKEVTVIQVEADPKVVADLETAKQALAALGCPFESLDACEPTNQDREVALLAEIDALRDDARVRQGALETIANERDRIEAGWEQSEKRL
ncbi:MAG: VWA domain-containing protein [Alphaproteobacteria bacterium]|nr:VWA domain-containing protein [Alphaproteobacteria bacterium]